ncbi:MAG TPA: kelch repeat-containing protein, partial [Thermoanaerobaculia bacterium]|nr:kelch repeat-containing protein [Thermoanaerobaculia bacterium]
QGASIAIDPATGVIYVVWRRFASGSQTDAIMVSRSLRGRLFSTPSVVVSLPAYNALTNPTGPSFFDQGTSTDSFRTNAYPTIAIDRRPDAGSEDDDEPDTPAFRGKVFVAWSQRGVGPGGDARVVLSVSTDGGSTWSAQKPVDNASLTDDSGSGYSFSRGHQFMPQMTVAADKITIIYYDARLDHTFGLFSPRSTPLVPDASGKLYLETRALKGELLDAGGAARVFTPFFVETGMTEWRHTLDLRFAQADSAVSPVFTSARLSQYIFGTRGDETGTVTALQQLQINPPNLKLFQDGSVPFIGDYIDVAGPTFLPPKAPGRRWRFNSLPGSSPVFLASWTSNQDVRPPLDGNWANYTPPGSTTTGGTSIFNGTTRPSCKPGNEGMRDQNIYAARISQGLAVSSVQNAKPLSTTVQRALSLSVENLTPLARNFRLTIVVQPAGGRASFVPLPNPIPNPLPNPLPPATTTLDVAIPANSSVARSVYALSTDPHAMIEVDVAELSGPATNPPTSPLKAGGLTSFVVFNTDPSAPNLIDPDGNTAPSVTTVEVYNPNVSNPNVSNPNVSNPNVSNPNVSNPNVSNPNVSNPNVSNPNVSNADLANPNVSNPNVSNPNVSNPNVSNPNVSNPNVSNAPVSDATYTVTNNGNTAASYRVQLAGTNPTNAPLQIIVSKPYANPASQDCVLFEQQHNVPISSVVNPEFVNQNSPPDPGITDPSDGNATFVLGPGDSALVTIRGPVDIPTLTNIVQNVAPVVVAHAPNTNDNSNRPATSPPVITTPALPDGVAGQFYSVPVTALGGTPGYVWTATNLPASLSIGGGTGLISGIPSAAGTFAVGVFATDAASKTGNRPYSLRIANPLLITTASLPNGSVGGSYSQALAATGGLGTYAWIPLSGSLPPGIGLSPAGVLSGTPTATGSYSFTVQVVDSASPAQTTTRLLAITILSAFVNVSAAPTGLVGGQPFTLTVHVEDNTAAPIPGALITLSFGSTGCPAALLSGTTSATTNVTGDAIFTNLSIDRGGPGFSINASASVPGYGVPVGSTAPFFVEGFCATGPTAPPRTYASLTKLADGRVLLAGGQTLGGVVLDTARIYDSSTGAFTPTVSNMLVPRFGHQAVLLPSGKVLIVGGSNPGGPTSSAELFDPLTLIFSPVASSMSVPRIAFRATWVPSAGKVLITGGQNTGGFLNSADVYDPSTGLFTPTGFMTTVRELHTATALSNGLVLVAGGAGGAAVGTAELWNPVTNAFGAIAPLAVGRDSHEAIALSDGRVLLVGGESTLGGSPLASAEIFDPTSGLFTLTGPMTASRTSPLVAPLPSGKILVSGGYGPGSVERTTAEIFDPASASFTATGSLVTTQGAGGAVLLSNGKALVAGSDQFNPNGELFYPTPGACDAGALAAAVAAAGGTTQTINLTGGCTYSFISGSLGDTSTALPHVTSGTNLTINGNGATIERLGVDGVPAFRLFTVDGGATLALNDLTVRNGGCGSTAVCPLLEGGGVLNAGTLNVTRGTFLSNASQGDLTNSRGGAIRNDFGTVSVDQSTFTGNRADNNGGAIFNWGGTLAVTSSTFRNNHAGNAGGALVHFSPAATTVTNSTFFGNSASGSLWGPAATGSALYSQSWSFGGGSGTVAVTNATFSANGTNGTISHDGGPAFALRNSILAYSGGANCSGVGAANDGGYNISSDASCALGAVGSLNSTDPQLDPAGLSSAGGPTQVGVPLPGSPAVDAIPSGVNGCGTTLTADQRGAARPTGAGCDIGAVEFPPVFWGWATLTNIKLNGGTNVLTLPGGGPFTLSHDYSILNPSDYCPYCIDQIEVGLAVDVPACTYNGTPTTLTNGTASTSLTAPSAPGVYYIGMDWALNWGCFEPVTPGVPVPPYWNSGPPGPNRYIGKVIVTSP